MCIRAEKTIVTSSPTLPVPGFHTPLLSCSSQDSGLEDSRALPGGVILEIRDYSFEEPRPHSAVCQRREFTTHYPNKHKLIQMVQGRQTWCPTEQHKKALFQPCALCPRAHSALYSHQRCFCSEAPHVTSLWNAHFAICP